VALVSQEPVLYARSVRRNIIYGLEADDGEVEPTQAAIEEAARQANAHDFMWVVTLCPLHVGGSGEGVL